MEAAEAEACSVTVLTPVLFGVTPQTFMSMCHGIASVLQKALSHSNVEGQDQNSGDKTIMHQSKGETETCRRTESKSHARGNSDKSSLVCRGKQLVRLAVRQREVGGKNVWVTEWVTALSIETRKVADLVCLWRVKGNKVTFSVCRI